MGLHCVAQRKRTVQIIGVVFKRYANRFPHGLQPGEMNDAVNSVFIKDRIYAFFITNIILIEREILFCQFLYAPYGVFVAIAKVVHHYDVVPVFQ